MTQINLLPWRERQRARRKRRLVVGGLFLSLLLGSAGWWVYDSLVQTLAQQSRVYQTLHQRLMQQKHAQGGAHSREEQTRYFTRYLNTFDARRAARWQLIDAIQALPQLIHQGVALRQFKREGGRWRFVGIARSERAIAALLSRLEHYHPKYHRWMKHPRLLEIKKISESGHVYYQCHLQAEVY